MGEAGYPNQKGRRFEPLDEKVVGKLENGRTKHKTKASVGGAVLIRMGSG